MPFDLLKGKPRFAFAMTGMFSWPPATSPEGYEPPTGLYVTLYTHADVMDVQGQITLDSYV